MSEEFGNVSIWLKSGEKLCYDDVEEVDTETRGLIILKRACKKTGKRLKMNFDIENVSMISFPIKERLT